MMPAPYAPPNSGYRLVYRPSLVNACPGCGHTHWHIGRHTAECAFCATALPLQHAQPSTTDMHQ